jgi:hypothetical protein
MATEGSSSSTSSRVVNLILLGEMHGSTECGLENLNQLQKFLPLGALKGKALLLVSETRGENPCYQFFPKTAKRLFEYDTPNQSIKESVLMLFLDVDLALGIARGETIQTPFKVDLQFFKDRFNDETAFRPLLEKVGVFDLYKKFVVNAILKKYNESVALLTEMTGKLIDYLSTQEEGSVLVPTLRTILQTNFDRASLRALTDQVNRKRDEALVKKIVNAIQSDPVIENVVVIMGDLHYDNLYELLSKYPFIRISEYSKPYTFKSKFGKSGGNRTRKTRRRRHAKKKTHRRKV